MWGRDRPEALARMSAALRETHIMGPHTNVAFLRRVVASESFSQADLDTALIERERAALFDAPPLKLELAAAGVLAQCLSSESALQGADPWSRRDGWRLHGAARRQLDIEVQGKTHAFVIDRQHGGAVLLQQGDHAWRFGAQPLGEQKFAVTLGEQRTVLSVYRVGERCAVFSADGHAFVTVLGGWVRAADTAHEGGRLSAPMPGKVVAYLAAVGARVQRGQALAVMEAMKMEHTISAPHDGVVKELLYAVGDQVAEGGELLRLGSDAP